MNSEREFNAPSILIFAGGLLGPPRLCLRDGLSANVSWTADGIKINKFHARVVKSHSHDLIQSGSKRLLRFRASVIMSAIFFSPVAIAFCTDS